MMHITRKIVLVCTAEKKHLEYTSIKVKKIPQESKIYLPAKSQFWDRIKKTYWEILIGVAIGIMLLFIQQNYF